MIFNECLQPESINSITFSLGKKPNSIFLLIKVTKLS